jgi:hypothetical protein
MVSNNNQTTMPAEPVSLSLETLQEAPGAWEHGEEYDPNAESRLTLAKATRDQAESARQKIAEEILEATRENARSSSSAETTPYNMPSTWRVRRILGTPKPRPS